MHEQLATRLTAHSGVDSRVSSLNSEPLFSVSGRRLSARSLGILLWQRLLGLCRLCTRFLCMELQRRVKVEFRISRISTAPNSKAKALDQPKVQSKAEGPTLIPSRPEAFESTDPEPGRRAWTPSNLYMRFQRSLLRISLYMSLK